MSLEGVKRDSVNVAFAKTLSRGISHSNQHIRRTRQIQLSLTLYRGVPNHY